MPHLFMLSFITVWIRKKHMAIETKTETKNPLGKEPVGRLMLRFAIPSIIGMLVAALYNIVDQLFIGNFVGAEGNGATNIAFPFTTACLSISLLFGIGGASCFNLSMGKEERDKAPYFVGNSLTMLVLFGTVIALTAEVFLTPMLKLFGASENILPFAQEYVRVTAIGFPFLMFTTGGCHLVRADGSPQMAMICNITGALINTALDALFIIVFDWGMFGAALATIIGQIISAVIVFIYILHYKTVRLERKHFKPQLKYVSQAAAIGMGSFFNQVAMLVVQIVLNNSLKHYGAASVYGEDIPLAVAGIVLKVGQIFFSIVIGIAQGTQPIESFNYGAKNYPRVREAYKQAIIASGAVSVIAFLMFMLIPRQILSLFGKDNSEQYFDFGASYFRIYFFFICLNFVQPVTSTFFTSIGKAFKGAFLSLTRQLLFLIPLMLILPKFFGIDGILYSGPIADFIAIVATLIMAAFEFKDMKRLETEKVMTDNLYRET